MYVFELAVKFRCSHCDAEITAPEESRQLVCPSCGAFQAARRSAMEHFGCWGGEIGRRRAEEELPARLAEQERLRRQRGWRRPVVGACWVLGVRVGRAKAIGGQMRAVEHRLQQCRRALDS